MTFADWQQLTPAVAARTLHERLQTRLAPDQQRAAVAQLAPEADLIARFEAAAAAPGSTPLQRVPYFAKDLFDAAYTPTAAGSTFLTEVRPPRTRDGAFIAAMRNAGAVLAGKAHMHEFAYGTTGENPHYGDVQRPGFPDRTTGGSSSGSAALVASGVVPLALGSDTGGSVRLPAAFCGLYGYRLAPRDPWISDALPLSPSYDTAGWFTAHAGDMRASLSALLTMDPVSQAPRGCYLTMPGVDSDVTTACANAARQLAEPVPDDLGRELLAAFKQNVDTYNTVVALEAWEVHMSWAEKYRERYSPGVWQRLTRAQSVTAAQVDAAQRHTAELREQWAAFFKRYDFLVLPASPAAAYTKQELTLENRLRILTLSAPASIGGLPVLTVPVALPSGLTTGLQIVVNSPTSGVIDWVLRQR
jgi:aspartyl-tRNA(Asn)/glutamyl-tRNA(Gln) amidotransferase subunit A